MFDILKGENEMTPDTRILFDKCGDALNVLEEMDDCIYDYGYVSVADLYDLADLPFVYTATKYGWTNLSGAYVKLIDFGRDYVYTIILPEPMPIDMGEKETKKEVGINEPLVRMINETENEFVQRINTRLEEGKLTPNAARKSMGLPEVKTETVTLYADNKPIYTVIREEKAALDDIEAVKKLYTDAIDAMKPYGSPRAENPLDKRVNDILKSWGM